jgi:hypothetical protein
METNTSRDNFCFIQVPFCCFALHRELQYQTFYSSQKFVIVHQCMSPVRDASVDPTP